MSTGNGRSAHPNGPRDGAPPDVYAFARGDACGGPHTPFRPRLHVDPERALALVNRACRDLRATCSLSPGDGAKLIDTFYWALAELTRSCDWREPDDRDGRH